MDFWIVSRFKEKGIKLGILMSLGWIFLALLFNGGIYVVLGKEDALEFLTGYVVEKALSIDNLFVIFLIFSHFKVPSRYQYKALLYGILGALVFRLTLILAGIQLISHIHWMTYVLGALLCITAMKVFKEGIIKAKKNPFILRLFAHYPQLEWHNVKERFWVRSKMTPFLLTILAIEGADLAFALDSIPAIFAITQDPFIVYTSNAFAVLGLRELYFVIAKSLKKLIFLPFGLSAILLFVGLKMLLEPFMIVSLGLSLAIIVMILIITIFFSLKRPLFLK